jgi:hypothetical protein
MRRVGVRVRAPRESGHLCEAPVLATTGGGGIPGGVAGGAGGGSAASLAAKARGVF